MLSVYILPHKHAGRRAIREVGCPLKTGTTVYDTAQMHPVLSLRPHCHVLHTLTKLSIRANKNMGSQHLIC